MTTETYIPIGDIPQRVLDAGKDDFGMEILYLPELRSKITKQVYAPQRDVLVINYGFDRYCPNCDEYVEPVMEIGLTWITDDPNESECEWDEIGEPFCPNSNCRETYFTGSPEEAAENARDSYYADRADAMRKGEW